MARPPKVFREGTRRSARLREKRLKELDDFNKKQSFLKFADLPACLRVMIYKIAMPPRIISPCRFPKWVPPAVINGVISIPNGTNYIIRRCAACNHRAPAAVLCARRRNMNGILQAFWEVRGEALNNYHRDPRFMHLVQHVSGRGGGAQFDYFDHREDMIFYESGMMVDWWRLYENVHNDHHALNFAIALQGSAMQPPNVFYNRPGWDPARRAQSNALLYSIEVLYHEFEDKIQTEKVPGLDFTMAHVKAVYIILRERERYHAEQLGDGPFRFTYNDWHTFGGQDPFDVELDQVQNLDTNFANYRRLGGIPNDVEVFIIYR